MSGVVDLVLFLGKGNGVGEELSGLLGTLEAREGSSSLVSNCDASTRDFLALDFFRAVVESESTLFGAGTNASRSVVEDPASRPGASASLDFLGVGSDFFRGGGVRFSLTSVLLVDARSFACCIAAAITPFMISWMLGALGDPIRFGGSAFDFL